MVGAASHVEVSLERGAARLGDHTVVWEEDEGITWSGVAVHWKGGEGERLDCMS